jgi:hypothetical protein
MLAACYPETQDEPRLAAEIISFSFQALEALSHAAGPDISLNHKLRLRGSAVSLSRESHKAQRKLDQLQKARRATPRPAEIPAPAAPPVKPAALTWTQAYEKRQTAKRIARNLEKNHATSTGAAPPAMNAARSC